MKFETQEGLNSALGKWQKILRLQDWNIRALISAKADMENTGAKGESHVYFDKQDCLLLLQDYQTTLSATTQEFRDEESCDMERTLVHEMLHIRFHPFRPEDHESLEHELWEQCIEVLAETLVRLNREPTGQPYRVKAELCPRCLHTDNGQSRAEILQELAN